MALYRGAVSLEPTRRAMSEPTILLLQARRVGDPILEHEYECFVNRTPHSAEAFRAVNMVDTPAGEEILREVDLVKVGGSGDLSVAQANFEWHDDFIDLIERIVDREIPMFASCFGFHALVKCFGGRLETDPDSAEIGTHEIRLTDEGRGDELFGEMPEVFEAQLGHKDSVVDLPRGLVRLAHSERCAVQAVRAVDRPIYATQFHPELTARDNIERYTRYIQNYKNIDETREEALRRAEDIHRESPEANRLLERFVLRYGGR